MAQERSSKKGSNKKIYWIIGVLVVLIVVLIVGRKQGWIGKSQVIEVEFGNLLREISLRK